MRVTHVITRLIVGGAQENTIASVIGLRQKQGLQVDLISGPSTGPEGSFEAMLANHGQRLRIVPELVRPIHPYNDLLAWWRLVAIFCATRPDIVHTHSGKAGFLGRLAAAHARVPIIVHTIHGPSFGPFQGPLPNRMFLAAEQWAGKVTTHFVTVAEAMRHQYLAAGIGRPDQYTTIFSGFELQPFLSAVNDLQLRARLGITPQDFVVGKIARLFKLKGHADLLAAAPALVAACPRIKFLLVGDGPWRSRFEKQVRALALDGHFILTGLVPPEAVAPLIGIMDVVVHLSLREGLARALPQALAAARPVIVYDCDGAKEVCFENETGFLVRSGDVQRLKERLLALARDKSLRARLGACGREFVRERFSAQRMVDSLHLLYLKLASVSPLKAPV